MPQMRPSKVKHTIEDHESDAEHAFMTRWLQLTALDIDDKRRYPKREWKFEPSRKWRFDFSWPDIKVAVEIEGGVYMHGRHTRGYGYESDCEKYNHAIQLGWKVLRYTPQMVEANPFQVITQIEMIIRSCE